MHRLLAGITIMLLAILEMAAPVPPTLREDDMNAPFSSPLDDAGSCGLTSDPALDIQGP